MNKTTYHKFFSNLSNQLKMDIVLLLRDSEKSVGEIVSELNAEQSKISHALVSLKECSIVTSKQNGKQRIYSLNKNTIVPILKLIDTHANKYCKCKNCGKLNCEKRK